MTIVNNYSRKRSGEAWISESQKKAKWSWDPQGFSFFAGVPNDIIFLVFKKIPWRDLAQVCSFVDKRFNWLSKNPMIWQSHCERDLPTLQLENKNPYQEYRRVFHNLRYGIFDISVIYSSEGPPPRFQIGAGRKIGGTIGDDIVGYWDRNLEGAFQFTSLTESQASAFFSLSNGDDAVQTTDGMLKIFRKSTLVQTLKIGEESFKPVSRGDYLITGPLLNDFTLWKMDAAGQYTLISNFPYDPKKSFLFVDIAHDFVYAGYGDNARERTLISTWKIDPSGKELGKEMQSHRRGIPWTSLSSGDDFFLYVVDKFTVHGSVDAEGKAVDLGRWFEGQDRTDASDHRGNFLITCSQKDAFIKREKTSEGMFWDPMKFFKASNVRKFGFTGDCCIFLSRHLMKNELTVLDFTASDRQILKTLAREFRNPHCTEKSFTRMKNLFVRLESHVDPILEIFESLLQKHKLMPRKRCAESTLKNFTTTTIGRRRRTLFADAIDQYAMNLRNLWTSALSNLDVNF